MGLTESEIFGNSFEFNSAGHDTTANTLSYCVLLLAAHPTYQDWIAEELQHVLNDDDSETWDYDETFPKLKRCLAILVSQLALLTSRRYKTIRFPIASEWEQLETLRMYPPIISFAKWTGEEAQTLKINNKTILIPAGTMVIPSVLALHRHPRYWGADSNVWRPLRWIAPSPESGANSNDSHVEQESLLIPTKGTFIPWSEGPRNCPGKKFAQVEVVAVLASLVRKHRIQPTMEPKEDILAAQKRTLRIIDGSAVRLLQQIRKPTKVATRWTQR